MNKYDRANYYRHSTKVITSAANGDNWFDWGVDLSSSLLLVEWRIMTPNRDKKLSVAGKVEVNIDTPLGKLAPTVQNWSISAEKLIQLINVPIANNLPYKLRFQHPTTVQVSQLTISEFIPYIQPQNIPMQYNPPTPLDVTPVVTALANNHQTPKEPPTISRTEVIMDNQKFYQCVAANAKNRAIVLTAMTDAEVRIWLTSGEAPAFDTTYFPASDWFGTPGYSYEMAGINSVVEIPEEFAMFAIWAISRQKAGVVEMGELAVAITTEGVLTLPAPLSVDTATAPINTAPAPTSAPTPVVPPVEVVPIVPPVALGVVQ